MSNMDWVLEAVKSIVSHKAKKGRPEAFYKYIKSLNTEMLLRAAEMYGTPQYVLSVDRLKKRANFFAETMRKHTPSAEFYYALKCNDLPMLVKSMKETGFNADVASLFELQLALRLGFDRIMFTGPAKTDEELKLAIENRDRVVLNIDNMDELHRVKEIMHGQTGAKLQICFRTKPDPDPKLAWTKFGIELSELRKAVDIAQSSHIVLAGLHFHSSWNKSPERYQKNIRYLGEWLRENFTEQEISSLQFIDLGGGFYPEGIGYLIKSSAKGELFDIITEHHGTIEGPASYDPNDFSMYRVDSLEAFSKAIGAELSRYIMPLNPDLKIYFEPGRFISAHATTILLRVMAVKPNCVIVDGGINLVGDYKFDEHSFAPIVNISNNSFQFNKKIIYGSLCDPYDLWGYSYFGEDIKKGDILAVMHQGAYTFSRAWRFIKPLAPYVAITKKDIILAKARESFDERYSGCAF